jgi:hypothetical protein
MMIFLVFSPFLYISLLMLGGLFNIDNPPSGWATFYLFMGYLVFLFSSVVIIFGLVYTISSDASSSEPWIARSSDALRDGCALMIPRPGRNPMNGAPSKPANQAEDWKNERKAEQHVKNSEG